MRVISACVDCPSLRRPVTARELTLSELRALIGEQERGRKDRGAPWRAAGADANEGACRAPAPPDTRVTLEILFGLTPAEAGRVAAEDLELLMAVATELNPDFFAPDTPNAPNAPGAANAATETRETLTVSALEKAAATVIAAGHPNAWDYPWRVFKTAVEALEESAQGTGNP